MMAAGPIIRTQAAMPGGRKGGAKLTTALVKFRSVGAVKVAPIAVMSIVTVMAGRPVAAWTVVHARGKA